MTGSWTTISEEPARAVITVSGQPGERGDLEKLVWQRPGRGRRIRPLTGERRCRLLRWARKLTSNANWHSAGRSALEAEQAPQATKLWPIRCSGKAQQPHRPAPPDGDRL